jgi:hypothetical protein
MEMEKMMQRLLAKLEERMNANAIANQEDAYHEKMMAMLDAHHKSIMACLGQTEANTEKTMPGPEMMQFVEENQEVPRKDAAVKTAKGLKK